MARKRTPRHSAAPESSSLRAREAKPPAGTPPPAIATPPPSASPPPLAGKPGKKRGWAVVGVAAGLLAGAGLLAALRPAWLGTSPPGGGSGAATAHGPWGDLTLQPILLEPPSEAIEAIAQDCHGFSTPWYFPGWTSAQLDELAARIADPAVQSVLRTRRICDTKGCSIDASNAERAAFTTAGREALYPVLARLENRDFSGSVHLLPEAVDGWLKGAIASEALQTYARGLFYQEGPFRAFSDPELVCERLTAGPERVRFVRALFAEEALVTMLRIDPSGDLSTTLAYWSSGPRRRKNIEPILRSLHTTGGGLLDVSHLLPRFARMLLYTFPPDVEEKYNCHWTALNFGRSQPSDEFLDLEKVLSELKTNYVPVEPSLRRYGDVVILTDAAGKLIHSAVYIAEEVVFTKNGISGRRPWVLARLPEMRSKYPEAAVIRYLRRRSPTELTN